ncbi:MAG: putative transporter [Pirellulales bacterium]
MLQAWDQLRTSQPVTFAILLLCLVSVAGLVLGKAKYRGMGLGTAGTLFSGLLFGQFNQRLDRELLEFVKDFGLILFVFAIGLRLGPGFASSLRRQGLRLNAIAASIIVGGALVAALLGYLVKNPPTATLGLFCGATTNTPSLGAAQQALHAKPDLDDAARQLPALAYAVSYPIGIMGLIASLLMVRWLFGINAERESDELMQQQQHETPPLERRTLRIVNRNLEGLAVDELPGREELGITVSRIRQMGDETVRPIEQAMRVQAGDLILAVGIPEQLDRFQRIVGERCEEDLFTAPGVATFRRVIVTRRDVLGRSLEDLDLPSRRDVTVTRVLRAEFEVPALPGLRLQFGDVLHLVGEASDLVEAERELGNSTKALNETQFLAIFAGIAVGILVGLLPISIPGLPLPVRLGLAGGPLVIAILVSRAGHLGPLVWYMPPSANLAFRELGITLFLAAIGLEAGERFWSTVVSAQGALWIALAVAITCVPLVCVGAWARWRWKVNYATLSGVMAGSLTDPPALAFASTLCRSDAPSVGYATVYPAAMLLRITAAQVLTLLLVP